MGEAIDWIVACAVELGGQSQVMSSGHEVNWGGYGDLQSLWLGKSALRSMSVL